MERLFDIGMNWHDPGEYERLVDADRSLFAWEWLRRDPAYQRAAAKFGLAVGSPGAEQSAARFGLVQFEDPGAAVPDARPLWRSAIHPQVLTGELSRFDQGREPLDLDRFRHLAHLVSKRQTDHLLLSDGFRAIRLDAPRGAFATPATSLQFRIGSIAFSEASLLALRRLLALARRGCFAPTLHPREPRAPRWILQLRTHDALASGADLRTIAEELLGRSAAGTGWRTRDPSLRSQAQRLVRSARELANGGFVQLLVH